MTVSGFVAGPRAGRNGGCRGRIRSRCGRRLGRGWRMAAIGPAGERRPLRDDLPRRPPRRARRPGRRDGGQEPQGRAGEAPGPRSPRPTLRRFWPRPGPARAVFGPATAKYRELGTLANLLAFNAISTLPTRNFTEATFEGAPRLAPRTSPSCAGWPATAAPPARSAASTSTPPRAARRCASSTRTSSRSGRCAGCPTPTRCSPRAPAATSWASTPSPRAAPSPGRWSAPNAA